MSVSGGGGGGGRRAPVFGGLALAVVAVLVLGLYREEMRLEVDASTWRWWRPPTVVGADGAIAEEAAVPDEEEDGVAAREGEFGVKEDLPEGVLELSEELEAALADAGGFVAAGEDEPSPAEGGADGVGSSGAGESPSVAEEEPGLLAEGEEEALLEPGGEERASVAPAETITGEEEEGENRAVSAEQDPPRDGSDVAIATELPEDQDEAPGGSLTLEISDGESASGASSAPAPVDPTPPKPAEPPMPPLGPMVPMTTGEGGEVTPRWCGGAPPEVLPWTRNSLTGQAVRRLRREASTGSAPTRNLLRRRRRLLLRASEEGEGEEGGEELRGLTSEPVEAAAVEEEEPYRRHARRLSEAGPKSPEFGSVYHGGNFGCSGKWTRWPIEHLGKGTVYEPLPERKLTRGQKAAAACVRSINNCGLNAIVGGRSSESVRELLSQSPATLGKHKRYKTCAIVGNAGHLVHKQYGPYIDQHELVVRFNVMTISDRVSSNVGNKTSIRIMNHSRSKYACCQGKLPERSRDAKERPTLVLWHPAAQDEIRLSCKKRFPENAVYGLSTQFIKEEAGAMKAMRKDLMKMGFQRFGPWKQLTSGGHAVLLFMRMCDTVSLYGFTSYPPLQEGPDQYGGRKKKSSSGRRWHDWVGESYAWRLLHATGRLTICSL